MRDCMKASVRDRLPDLLHGRLPASERAEVEQHVASCADCSAELDLLRAVRGAVPTPVVDVERIVAALPRRGRRGRRRVRWQGGRVASLVAAAVVLLALGSILRWSYGGRHDVPAPQRPALSLGEPLVGLSNADLRALVDAADHLDAVMSTRSDTHIPSLEGAL